MARKGIGGYDRRPLFYNWQATQDLRGGSTDQRTEEWYYWVRIEDRTGNTYAAEATQLTQYDYKVEGKFDRRFNSSTRMVYEGQVCKMESMSVVTEGYKDVLVMRFSKTETYLDVS